MKPRFLSFALPSGASRALSRLFAHLGCLRAALVALAALAFLATSVPAAVTEAWVHRYNNPLTSSLSDTAVAIARDPAGNVIVTGSSELRWPDLDMLTIKYSGVDGTVLWQRRYDGPGHAYDGGVAVVVDAQGNVIVTGESHNGTTNEIGDSYIGMDIYTAKYAAADGSLLWEQRHNNPHNTGDSPTALAVDTNGNVIVTGSSGWDFYTAKYAAANGALLWENRYNGPTNGSGSGNAIAVDPSGNVIVTGSSHASSLYSDVDFYTAKYAGTDGALLWEHRYNGPIQFVDVACAVAVDASDNVVVTGHFQTSTNGYKPDFYTVKYAAADGAILWEKLYNGPGDNFDAAKAVALDSNDNVIVTGISASRGTPNTRLYFDYYTAKYAAANGALIWERRFNGPADESDEPYALTLDHNGNVFVTGFSINSLPGFNADFYTAKYRAADGAVLWEKRHDSQSPLNLSDQAQAVAVDHNGNVVVTGLSDNGTNLDFYTAKYAMTTGALLWEKRYNGPANGDDVATAIAADSSGNVVVTGYSHNGSNDDYYTAKYAATDGALLWEKRYNGPANGRDFARTLVLDGAGNVIVTGGSRNIHGENDYYTAKYAAADGALMWEQRLGGDDENGGSGAAIVVDGSGNVVVTGSYETRNGSQFRTVKYGAANGTQTWVKTYSGPVSDSGATAVAVDSSGNVVVTGYSEGSQSENDYYTAKYAGADGALLWEKRYNGPANNDDAARAVAVDSSGNVFVTGTHNADRSETADYYTAKYAAADGVLLWERTYNGPDNDGDHAVAIAVDVIGNVIVTGSSESDALTVKYAGTDGALLWEKRSKYRPNGDYLPSSLALGPNGMVAITGTFTDENDETDDYVTIVYREGLSIDLVPTGARLRFTGTPAQRYNIERASTVTGPWSTNATLTAASNGSLEDVDTNTLSGSAFYRTSTP